jgi:anti-sigma factor RsiW
VTCDELQTLLHGYVDGELDLMHQLDAERHLESCPDCARACERLQELQAMLKDDLFRHEPPPRLCGRIAAALDEEGPVRAPRRSRLWPALASCAAALALVAWGAMFWFSRTEEDRVAQEVVASHVRSLMVDHLTDVTSTDRHTVRPWFQDRGKIDFSPTVPDLTAQDFILVGGRLDYVDNRVVAALVYKRRKHTINVLIWPSNADKELRSLTRQTYHLIHFARGGMTTWAVSDLNPEELRAFGELLRQHDQP